MKRHLQTGTGGRSQLVCWVVVKPFKRAHEIDKAGKGIDAEVSIQS